MKRFLIQEGLPVVAVDKLISVESETLKENAGDKTTHKHGISFTMCENALIRWNFKDEKKRDKAVDYIHKTLSESEVSWMSELVEELPDILKKLEETFENSSHHIDHIPNDAQNIETLMKNLEPLNEGFFMLYRGNDIDGLPQKEKIEWLDTLSSMKPDERGLHLTTLSDLYYLWKHGETDGIRIAAGVIFGQEKDRLLKKRSDGKDTKE